MSTNIVLLLVVGVMGAAGAYMLMERSLVRMLLGLLLCGNAINLLIITISGDMGHPPLYGSSSDVRTTDADPLAQALILTAIVITMGIAAFVLALIYRIFVINRDDDELTDDSEDVKILSGADTAPDRDRTDDPVTGKDTTAGDLFDDAGNPLTAQEYAELHKQVIETDLLPADGDDVIDEMVHDDDDSTDENASTDANDTENGDTDGRGGRA